MAKYHIKGCFFEKESIFDFSQAITQFPYDSYVRRTLCTQRHFMGLKNIARSIFILAFSQSLFFCQNGNRKVESTPDDSLSSTATLFESTTFSGDSTSEQVKHYIRLIESTLTSAVPILGLQRTLSTEEEKVQQICLSDNQFKAFARDSSGRPFRNEIFGIYPARESDLQSANKGFFTQGGCYRVELYNFAKNVTTIAVVSLPENRCVQVGHFVAMQPELPEHLKKLAIRLAVEDKRVINALNLKPDASEALMADTKTALNSSRCERSKHLCVAPTFVQGKKALWSIVDLTALRVAGIRWTNLGETPTITEGVSERKLQNEFISNCFCKTTLPLQRNGWNLNYMITGNDGLRVSEVAFKGKKIIQSAKLVDWHVSYSNTDGFGYSDAVGCPYFSSATVVAIEAPKIAELFENGKKAGFSIEQFYRSDGWPSPCNYEYFQRYEFYDDGRFRISAANIGRGCGNDGTYRPVFRIAFEDNVQTFNEWRDGQFRSIPSEGWRLQGANSQYDPEGAMFQLKTKNLSYRLVPGNGQFGDGGRGDNAYVYFSSHKSGFDEGESDLPTIGPCCNTDYHQGPEKFIEPRPDALKGRPVVIWYVPQIKNDDTKGKEYCWAEARLVSGVLKTESFPCIAGPMFIPN